MIEAAAARKLAQVSDVEKPPGSWPRRIATFLRGGHDLSAVTEGSAEDTNGHERNGTPLPRKLRTDMIRRMDDAPKLVDPNGWISEGRMVPMKRFSTIQSVQDPPRHLSFADLDLDRSDLRNGQLKSPFTPVSTARYDRKLQCRLLSNFPLQHTAPSIV